MKNQVKNIKIHLKKCKILNKYMCFINESETGWNAQFYLKNFLMNNIIVCLIKHTHNFQLYN